MTAAVIVHDFGDGLAGTRSYTPVWTDTGPVSLACFTATALRWHGASRPDPQGAVPA